MPFYWLILGVLGVWRITHLLHAEDGPGDMFVKFHDLAGKSIVGKAMDCFLCLSLWVAAPFALLIGQSWIERAMLWFALSGGAILIERVTAHETSPRAVFVEDAEDQSTNQVEQEDIHVQLWK